MAVRMGGSYPRDEGTLSSSCTSWGGKLEVGTRLANTILACRLGVSKNSQKTIKDKK